MLHLDADTRGCLTQCQNGVVLGSVQPVDSQFGACGPFHHGDVIFPPEEKKNPNKDQDVQDEFGLASAGLSLAT